MSDLTDFLRARLDEDRAWADNPECVEDPARVLREVETKRRIVERYEANPTEPWPLFPLYELATIYADHLDYREEWKPVT